MNTPKMPDDVTTAMLTTKFVNHFCHRNLSDDEVYFIYRLMSILKDSSAFETSMSDYLSRLTLDYQNSPVVRHGQGIEGDVRVTIPSSRKKLKTR